MPPKWTVLYNIVSDGSRWIGTGWEFFDDEHVAHHRFEELSRAGNYPTRRPYFAEVDRVHLGAGHGYAAEPT